MRAPCRIKSCDWSTIVRYVNINRLMRCFVVDKGLREGEREGVVGVGGGGRIGWKVVVFSVGTCRWLPVKEVGGHCVLFSREPSAFVGWWAWSGTNKACYSYSYVRSRLIVNFNNPEFTDQCSEITFRLWKF